MAIVGCKHVYPDVIKKSIPVFDEIFKDQIEEMKYENNVTFQKLGE